MFFLRETTKMNLFFKRLSIFASAVSLSIASVASAATVAVDATKTFQTIDGFGACSAWISSKITADLADQFWLEDDVDGHIGLSLLRVIIPCSGSYTTEFAAAPQALKLNPKIKVWGAAWSPPSKYKSNGNCVGGTIKSDATSLQGYADYLVKFVTDAKSKYDVDIYAVSCQNEPDWNPSYDGCKWSGDQFKEFVRDYWGPTCKTAGITAKRMIGESYSCNTALTDPALKDTAAASFVDIIGEHLYGGGPNAYPLAATLNKRYWETENSGMNGPDESITNGIMYANIVHKCLVKCGFNAYHYWWLVNNNGDDEGLCNRSGKPTPRMYTIGNFSKFIRPGFIRIGATEAPATGITASAYFGASYGRLVIVAINSGSASKTDFTVTGFSATTTAVPWLTDAKHNLQKQTGVTIANGAFSYELPAKSVMTFVLSDGSMSIHRNAKRCPGEQMRLLHCADGWRTEVPFSTQPWKIQLLTPSGRVLSCQNIPVGHQMMTIDETGGAGVVLIRVQQGEKTWTSLLMQPE
jgi:glucuronoarabinoxylan endo-1,4-beta-xylanase